MSETKRTPIPWQYAFFTKFDGNPIETAQDVADTVALSALKSDKGELWGITIETGEKPCPVVCYTGNGPTSEANARFIVRALNSHEALLEALKTALRCAYEAELGPHDPESWVSKAQIAVAIAEGRS